MGDYVIDDSADVIVFSHAGLELSSAVSPVLFIILWCFIILFYFILFIILFIYSFLIFYFILDSDRKATVTTPILTSSPL